MVLKQNGHQRREKSLIRVAVAPSTPESAIADRVISLPCTIGSSSGQYRDSTALAGSNYEYTANNKAEA